MIFPGYIDHNDNLTTKPLLGSRDTPYGEQEVGQKLLSLLKIKSPTASQGLHIYDDRRKGSDHIVDYYSEQVGDVIVVNQEQRVFLSQHGGIGELSEDQVIEEDVPGEMMRYTIYLPLWYIISYYINNFELLAGKEQFSLEFYKMASKRELVSLLDEVVGEHDKRQKTFNHDQWTILNGNPVNIGG